MNTIIDRLQRAKVLPIQLNGNTITGLFEKYEEIGFLYPEKKKLLLPHFSEITDNWEKLLSSKEEILWTLTTKEQALKKDFASITAWKQSNYGLFAQHLVSTGNPLLSLKVMMAAQDRAEFHFNETEVLSCQNWFRPTNRYAFRVFASMYEKLGPQKSSLLLFQYLHLSFANIPKSVDKRFEIEEVVDVDSEFIKFLNEHWGEVFVKGEELDRRDIQFLKLNATYQKYGLSRTRKVLKIKDAKTGKILACVIANRAPLGLNFSFLENRAYYVVPLLLEEELRAALAAQMNSAIQSFYSDIVLQAIPIITDAMTSETLILQKAVFQRKYHQSIWLREGFSEWYDHIYSFLQRIEERMNR